MYIKVMKSIKIPLRYPVVSNPKILGGIPVIKGTRIPASLVFDLIKRGYSVQLVNKEYPSLSTRKLNAFLKLMTTSFDDHSQKAL